MIELSYDVTKDKKDGKVRAEIEANLKRVYSDTLNETVPDRLKQLLEELRQTERKQ